MVASMQKKMSLKFINCRLQTGKNKLVILANNSSEKSTYYKFCGSGPFSSPKVMWQGIAPELVTLIHG
uniref:Uncharacterized protein n=1 Tax=Accipiter nisus TaxID=211598 RepID=A0A8B9MDC5_9AVES